MKNNGIFELLDDADDDETFSLSLSLSLSLCSILVRKFIHYKKGNNFGVKDFFCSFSKRAHTKNCTKGFIHYVWSIFAVPKLIKQYINIFSFAFNSIWELLFQWRVNSCYIFQSWQGW